MSTVDIATFKANADHIIAKAIEGQPTIIEQNGKRVVLMPLDPEPTDADLYPEIDELLTARLADPAFEPTSDNWDQLQKRIKGS